jgi:tetratricopeptide (TPR) repeat protein
MRRSLTLSALLLASIVASPSFANENYDNGVKAFQAGNFTAAAEAFQAYVDSVPDAYEGHYMLGNALLKAKKYAEAVKPLQTANELKPSDSSIQLSLAQALTTLKRGREACAVLDAISEASLSTPQKTSLYGLKANAGCGSPTEALAKVAQSKPTDATAQAAYGVALLADAQVAQAVAALDKAVSLAPTDVKIRKSQLSALVTQARSTTSDSAKQAAYNKAVSSADQLVKLNRNFDSLLLLGEVQLGAKQYSAAVTSLQGAASAKPGDWLPNYYLGQAFTSLERYPEAAAALAKALAAASSENQRNVNRALGFAHEKQKNFAESIRYYELAGDQSGVARVRTNQETAQFNSSVEESNAALEKLRAEQEALERELQNLPTEDPPR